MKKLFAILIILVLSVGFKAKADEGMWLLPLIEKLNMGKMTAAGSEAFCRRYLQS